MNLEELFFQKFGSSNNPVRKFFSPGRVNLIGEHLDYNGGSVLPIAIQLGITLLVRKRNDGYINLSSLNQDQSFKIDINSFPKKVEEWIKYPLGVFDQFLKKEIPLEGMDLLYWGTLPFGAGLSSSAAMEMVTAFALNETYNSNLSTKELVKISYKAERIYAGVQCGIMDQYIVGFGKKDHALLIDCEKAEHQEIPCEKSDYQFVIVNSNHPRELASSEFNHRREECEEALKTLNQKFSYKNLTQLTVNELPNIKKYLENEKYLKRVSHVVSENQRVQDAKDFLMKKDWAALGRLMNESHASLKNDFEVTGHHLDTLAEGAQSLPYVLGSRMTGAGFGGCTINLIKKGHLKSFKRDLTEIYLEKTQKTPEFYSIEISEGAHELNERK